MKRLALTTWGTCINRSMQSTQLITSITGLTLVFGSFGVYAAPPPPYNSTSASIYYNSPSDNGLIFDPVSAQYNYPLVSGQNSAYVGLIGTNPSGLPEIDSGVYASSSNGGWVNTETNYQTSLLINSGTSGLVIGSLVTLQLSLQLDGTTNVITGNDAGYANMSYNFSIKAPDQQYDTGEGWYVPTLMNFSADVNNSVDNFFTYYYGDPGGAWYHDTIYTAGWNWNSNLASGSGGNANDYSLDTGYSTTASDSNFFDTGIVLIDFEAIVGETLNIDSYFGVWGDSYGAGSLARADFLNSLKASIASPYETGVDLVYGGVSSVPLPATVWLFGSGLLGLVAVARRKAA